MPGQAEIVIVRGANGSERRLALVSHTDDAAFVCPLEKYEAVVSGRLPPPMVGFPLEDVRRETDGQPLK